MPDVFAGARRFSARRRALLNSAGDDRRSSIAHGHAVEISLQTSMGSQRFLTSPITASRRLAASNTQQTWRRRPREPAIPKKTQNHNRRTNRKQHSAGGDDPRNPRTLPTKPQKRTHAFDQTNTRRTSARTHAQQTFHKRDKKTTIIEERDSTRARIKLRPQSTPNRAQLGAR